jgi:LptD protein
MTGGLAHPGTDTVQKEDAPKEVQIPPKETRKGDATKNHLPEQDAPSKEATDPLQASSKPPGLENTDVASSSSDNAVQDPVPTEPESPIQAIIQYDAKDAIFFDVKHQTIRLYGAGIIEHDTIKLEAEEVFLDWTNHTIAAFSKKNETGAVDKKAVLTKDGVEYFAESVHYNFESQRAVAHKLFTKQDEGILRANKIKKDRETTFYADRATYTTCNLIKPHFHAGAKQLKITQDDKVVSGPFRLYFDGVPTPLGLPFGIFYLPQGSGIIPPKYGGESEQGFCLKDGGYYIKLNDYVCLSFQGSIYSKGAKEFSTTSIYKRRYRYGGNLHFERKTYPNPQETQLPKKDKIWSFRWKHDTENNRYSSWHIQVDLERKSAHTQNVFQRPGDYQTKKDSSIRYTNSLVGFPIPYTLDSGLSLRTSQNGEANASLPKVLLGTKNIYPFRKRDVVGTRWYSDIHLQHTLEFQNKLSNSVDNTLDFFKLKDWPALWKDRQQGAQHTLPLQTNIKILSYLNLTPKVTYREQWYWEKINYKYDAKGVIREDKIPGFVRVYNYDFGTTLKTTFYGTHIFGEGNTTVQAIRHQIKPVLAFTYTPDFSGTEYGYWQTMKGGNQDGEKFNRFKGALCPSPGEKATAVLAISLNNRLDMKVKSETDAKKRTKKIPMLESFDWSTSYDFLADHHALGDIDFKTRTKLFDQLLDVSFESTFDPYAYNTQEYTRSDEFAWNHGKGLGHMKKASLSIGTKLGSSKGRTLNQSSGLEKDQEAPTHLQEDATQYVNFKIPSNLALDYRWSYSCLTPWDNSVKTNSLSFTWCVNLTDNWTVTCKSAYDLNKREFVGSATDIGIERDLHCWRMDFHWNPLGERQTYKFSVGLKAALLKDIEYSRDRAYTKQ